MYNYITLLALSYFKQAGAKYSISELMQILGLTQHQIDSLIHDLLNDNLIEYKDYLLSINEKGIRILIASDRFLDKSIDAEYDLDHIDRSNAMSIDEAYVPDKFSKKV